MRAAGETTKFADGGVLGSQKRERGVRGTFAYRTWRLRHLRVRSVGLETHATADVEIGVPAIRSIYSLCLFAAFICSGGFCGWG